MKRPIVVWFLILTSVLAHAEDTLTPAETRQIQETAAQLQSTCTGEFQKVIDGEKADPGAALVNYLSPRYCTCLSESAVQRLTPHLLRTGREQDFQRLFVVVAQDCAANEFKESFPKICLSWFGQLPKLDAKKVAEIERKVGDACACMQHDVNSVDGSQLSEVTRATLQDYSDYQKDPKSFTSSRRGSLFPSWQACAEAAR